MKNVICFLDSSEVYVKKLTNYAIKKYGKEYLFLSFTNVKTLIEYSEENKIKVVVMSNDFEKDIKNIFSNLFYVQQENKDNRKKEGNIKYVYKYQNVDNLLDEIDKDIKGIDEKSSKVKSKTKLIVFYSPYQSKMKLEKIGKFYRTLSKKKKVLYIELDEYLNFMGERGLSNIIYKYKENILDNDAINKEIIEKDDIWMIPGISYPEDYAVINNADLSEIISSIKELNYDYIFINCDSSFVRNQYLFVECDNLFLFDGAKGENEKNDIFMKYVELQNMLEISKIYRMTKEVCDSKSVQNIIDELFVE